MALRPRDLRKDTLYTRARLLERGMHRRHLASEAMVRVFPGWWMRTDAEPSLLELASFFQQEVRLDAVISHATAAELQGFPLPVPLTRAGGAPIHCHGPQGAPRSAGGLVVAHRYRSAPVIRHHGVTMSHPVIALQEIASSLDLVDLVVCLDALAADRHGTHLRMPLSQISDMLDSLEGRGAPALRQALPYVRERSWSPMETRMRLLLLTHGWPEPELNLEVRDPATGKCFFIDLAYRSWKIAIEYDSEIHRTDKKRWQDDLHKNEVLHRLGWTVLRVSIADYQEPADFFQRLDEMVWRRDEAVPG